MLSNTFAVAPTALAFLTGGFLGYHSNAVLLLAQTRDWVLFAIMDVHVGNHKQSW